MTAVPFGRPPRPSQVVVCGLGGQGILFLTRCLGEAAMHEGREVLTAENHGMAQRGGVVDSHVKVGDFASPLVRVGHADVALALDPVRVPDARAFAGRSGACFANAVSSSAPAATAAGGAGDGLAAVAALVAADVAREAGCDGLQNLVLLGFAAARAPDRFPAADSLRAALARLSGPARGEANARAFEAGRSRA